MNRLKIHTLGTGILKIILGMVAGIIFLELILNSNTHLLLRGMSVSAPIDQPLLSLNYAVRYSDADIFLRRRELIKPIQPHSDQIEAYVNYQTDEFGFRNPPGLTNSLPIIVLGRSTSAGAQVNQPWPALLHELSNICVINLSQPSLDIYRKKTVFEKFGQPRKPSWVIIEVNPQLDILGGHPPKSVVEELPIPLIQNIVDKYFSTETRSNQSNSEIFPFQISNPGSTKELVCCTDYMEFYSLDRQSLQQSQDWNNFTDQLDKLMESIIKTKSCPAILYTPGKQNIYLADIVDQSQVNVIFNRVYPLRVTPDGEIERDLSHKLSSSQGLDNLNDAKMLVQSYSEERNILWIDPSEGLLDAFQSGSDPFLKYDSHWNQLGHRIIANVVYQTILNTSCP